MENKPSMDSSNKRKFYETTWFMWVTLVFFAPVGIFVMWRYNRFSKPSRIVTSIIFGLFFIVVVASGNSKPSNETAVKPVETAKVVSANKEKTAEEIKKEADEKTKADADAKTKADEKAKADADAKIKAEQKIKDDAAAKAKVADEANKSVNATLYKALLAGLPDNKPKMKDVSFNFLKDNNTLFPAKTSADVAKVNGLADSTIGYKHLDKDITPYLNKIIIVNGTIVSIEQEDYQDKKVSLIHIFNDNMESIQILYLDSVDVFKGDSITCLGLPVAMNGFANVSGGTTKVAVLIGATVKKN